MKLRRLIVTYMRPYRWVLLVTVILQGLQALASLLLPELSANLIDNGVLRFENGVLDSDIGYIWRTGGVMMAITLVQVLLAIAAVYLGARIAMGFCRDVRRDLFHQVTDFSAQEVSKFGPASLITRITNDVQQVQMLVALTATMMLAAPLTLVIGVVMAMRIDLGLSWIMLVAIPTAVVTLGVLVALMVPSFQKMQLRIDRINQVLREQITGTRVVRAFVREDAETERFAEANSELTEVSLRTGRIMALMIPTINVVVYGANIVVLAVGAPRVAAGALPVGSLFAYLSYLMQVLMSVVMTTFVTSMVPRASVAADRIVDVLDTDTSVHPPDEPITEMPTRGTVQLDDAGFGYPGADHPVLCHVSFAVGPGETTAIIGGTGAGKSTLVNLVVRMFDATEGTVLVNGVNVRDLDPKALWSSVGYVPQKAFLFSGTVASNLRYGRPEATDAELWEALEVAQVADFVRSMPDGLNSTINQGGTNVSGGQRQRLSIARAIVAKPDVYIFDDSFSALDLSTEARLRAALEPITADAAVLMVAQRISSIRNADQIVVLDAGDVVGLGTHEELLTTCETYREIVDSQFDREGA